MLSRPIKTKRNRLLMGSVLITILFFQNCMKGGLEGAGDSALGSGDSSQGGGIGGGGNNPPPPPTMPTNQISVVATPFVSMDCSQDNATLLMQVQDGDAEMRICLEYTLDVPYGSPDYGSKGICTSDSSFKAPGTPWVYNLNQRTWTKPLVKLNTQTSYKPGIWRWHVRDNHGRENVTPYVKILRTGYKDCLPSTPKTPPPVPVGGITGDTGWGTGLWVPPGTSGFWVVDQSGIDGTGSQTAFPGCVNGGSVSGACNNSYQYSLGNNYITMAQGNVLAIRYRTKSTLPSLSSFTFYNAEGNGLPATIIYSLSILPGDFSNAACTGNTAILYVGNSTQAGCKLSANTQYYLNISTTSPCSGVACRFKVNEAAGLAN